MKADDVWTGRAVYEAVHGALEMSVRPTVREYLDESEENSVDIATFDQRPGPGWVTYSTVTLHAEPNVMDGQDVPVELMGSVMEGTEEFAEVLSTAAFFAGTTGWLAVPGVVFPDVVQISVPDTTTPHLLWVTPFVWPELATIEVPGVGPVHWLQGVPLDDAEVGRLQEIGYWGFNELLEQADVRYGDLRRPSIL